MAWKNVRPMEERIRFVLEAEQKQMQFSELCREYGISRKTGYKWVKRYQDFGLFGIRELSRRPWHHPNQTEFWIEELIIKERRKHPSWGPKKLWKILEEKYGADTIPCAATIGNILNRNGLSRKRRIRRKTIGPNRSTRTEAAYPNAVWSSDFKGWFYTRDRHRCDPLTISDLYSRYVISCQIVRPTVEAVKPRFERVFRRYGLPEAIRVDNGPPFGSRGLCGLTGLSAWWIKLGINVEFIEPGHPEQNGVHERMHRTLKDETARPPAVTIRAQQRRFDTWRREFNNDRPHEALDMQRPAQRYKRSPNRYSKIPDPIIYPRTYEVRNVRTNGEIKWKGDFYYIGEALHGMSLGIEKGEYKEHKVYFRKLFLGIIDESKPGALRPPASDHQAFRKER